MICETVKVKLLVLMILVVAVVGDGLTGAASADTSALDAFNGLVGGRWRAQGEWANGQKFVQEIEYTWALNQTIVVTQSYGPVSPDADELTHRNHGIRAAFPEKNTLWFWEFAASGGLTQGEITIDGQTIALTYAYGEGEQRVKLRDRWTRIDTHTYDFTVEQYADGNWDTVLLKTQFRRLSDPR